MTPTPLQIALWYPDATFQVTTRSGAVLPCQLVGADLREGFLRMRLLNNIDTLRAPSEAFYSPEDCKPMLLDFADLATPLTLADGTVVVPAVEVAKLMAPGCDNWLPLTTTMPGKEEIVVYNAKGFREFSIYAHQMDRLPAVVADYLRRLHFAVGLPADSWVRREAARV